MPAGYFDDDWVDLIGEIYDIESEFQPSADEAAKRLDPFQLRCVQEINKSFTPGSKKRQYLYVATGGGKTLITVDYLHQHVLKNNGRVLWITHQPYLIYQAAKTIIQRFGQHYDIANDIAYFGSKGDHEKHFYRKGLDSYRDRDWPRGTKPLLLFATWQALGNENNLNANTHYGRKLRDYAPDLVVIDEAHWGKGGELERNVYSRLFNRTWDRVPILGLSATPKVRRAEHSRWESSHIGNVHFSSLVGTRLARPYEIKIDLESNLDLKFDRFNRIESVSFRELAENKHRNGEIVKAYIKDKYRLGKTLVIAASIRHADLLEKEFERQGQSVVAIHSQVRNPTTKLKEFIDGEYLVAIVVGMAREGVDIPDLKTVMLAKPITSEVEFAQFIGRASRRFYRDNNGNLKTKDLFYIVDFYDTLANPENKKLLYHFKDYFCGVNDREKDDDLHSPNRSDSRPILTSIENRDINADTFTSHEYRAEPVYKTLRYVSGSSDIEFAALNNMRINTQQTFGIEFEIAPKKPYGPNPKDPVVWKRVAKELQSILIKVFGRSSVESHVVPEDDDVKDINHKVWNVVYDGSCGWEIVSPILKGENGFKAILKFLSVVDSAGALEKLGLEVNTLTGTHVNLGWNFSEPRIVQNLLYFMRMYEPSLFTLVPPSRIFRMNGRTKEPSEYCAPIGTRFSPQDIAELNTKGKIASTFKDYEERYHSVNLTKFSDPVQVLEVRLHGGTVEAGKILLWLSLWMNILAFLSREGVVLRDPINSVRLSLPVEKPSSDILYVLKNVLGLSADEEIPYLELVDQRRNIAFSANTFWKDALKENHRDVVNYLEQEAKKLLKRQ